MKWLNKCKHSFSELGGQNMMKKRILSLILVIAMCITLMPTTGVFAAEENKAPFSAWAQDDLIIGDTYGIYPQNWYTKGMTVPIKQGQLRVILAGIRTKIVKSGCITKENGKSFILEKYLTVEQVLDIMYDVISSYEFTEDIGLKESSVAAFMKEHGIYTGKDGELGLSDICTIEQACVMATRLVTYLYDALDGASKGFLWEAKSGENTVYMLGSIHLASFDIYPFSKKMLEAYASADALAVEVNMYDMTGAMALAQLGMYMDGTTLKDHVSEDTYKKTIELAAKMGYREEQIASVKPWYIYCLFSALAATQSGDPAQASVAAALGIDMFFLTNAYIYGKPILEVEGLVFQGNVFDSFSDGLEEYLLDGTVDAVNEVLSGTDSEEANYLDLMLEYWSDGDAEAFKKFTSPEFEYPELYEEDVTPEEKALIEEFQDKLMTKRDKGMAEYIDNLLKSEGSNTYFVIVGSGHYISNYSVLDVLKEKGYEINQVK